MEFDSLADRYRTSDPEGTFNYFAFCNNINSAFTQKGIDKDPTHSVKAITSDDTMLARRKYLEGITDEEIAANEIVAEYRKVIQNKRLNLKPMFQDFDITKNSHVTKV